MVTAEADQECRQKVAIPRTFNLVRLWPCQPTMTRAIPMGERRRSRSASAIPPPQDRREGPAQRPIGAYRPRANG